MPLKSFNYRGDRVFVRSRIGYVAADEFVRVDIADERAHRFEMLLARPRLIVIVKKGDCHESLNINGKGLIDQTSELVRGLCSDNIKSCPLHWKKLRSER